MTSVPTNARFQNATWSLQRVNFLHYSLNVVVRGETSQHSIWAISFGQADKKAQQKFRKVYRSIEHEILQLACPCGNSPLTKDDLSFGLCKCCREGHVTYHDDMSCRRCGCPRQIMLNQDKRTVGA